MSLYLSLSLVCRIVDGMTDVLLSIRRRLVVASLTE